jgi:hypothetical protein
LASSEEGEKSDWRAFGFVINSHMEDRKRALLEL